jgi:hypothetical protein
MYFIQQHTTKKKVAKTFLTETPPPSIDESIEILKPADATSTTSTDIPI